MVVRTYLYKGLAAFAFLAAPLTAQAAGNAFQCFLPADDGSDQLGRPYWFDFYHDWDNPRVTLSRLGQGDLEITNCKFVYSEDPGFKTHLICYGEDDDGKTLTIRLGEAGYTQAFFAKIDKPGSDLGVPCQTGKDSVLDYLYGP